MSETAPTWPGPELSSRQQSILACIAEYTRLAGWAPSYREIGRICGISSTSMVAYHVRQLVAMGYLVRGTGARQIRVVKGDGHADVS